MDNSNSGRLYKIIVSINCLRNMQGMCVSMCSKFGNPKIYFSSWIEYNQLVPSLSVDYFLEKKIKYRLYGY